MAYTKQCPGLEVYTAKQTLRQETFEKIGAEFNAMPDDVKDDIQECADHLRAQGIDPDTARVIGFTLYGGNTFARPS